MKLIYEKQVNGENKLFYSNENIPTETDIEILPEQVQKINEVMQELDQQLDPETEGTLANTVDSVVTEIGTDETEGSILGRISALESGGGGQSSGTLVYFTASKSDRVITPTSSANYTNQEIIDMIFISRINLVLLKHMAYSTILIHFQKQAENHMIKNSRMTIKKNYWQNTMGLIIILYLIAENPH